MVHSSGLSVHLVHNLLRSCDECVSLGGVVTRDRKIGRSECIDGGSNRTIYLDIVIRLTNTFHSCCY